MVGTPLAAARCLSAAIARAMRTARVSIAAPPSNSRSLIASTMSNATGDASGTLPWRSAFLRRPMEDAGCRGLGGRGAPARWDERLTENVQHAAEAAVLSHLARRETGVAFEHVAERRRRGEVEQQRDLLDRACWILEHLRSEGQAAPRDHRARCRKAGCSEPINKGFSVDSQCGRRICDRHRLTSVLERVAEKWNDALRDEWLDRLEHVFRAAMLLRRGDDRSERDTDVIHTAQNQVVHAGARERENVARRVGSEHAVRDDGDAWKPLTNGPYHSDRRSAGAIAEVHHGDADEPFRHERKQFVLRIAGPDSRMTAQRFLNARACGLLANQYRDDHRKNFGLEVTWRMGIPHTMSVSNSIAW